MNELHLKTRRTAKHKPLKRPFSPKTAYVYSEQVGEYLQPPIPNTNLKGAPSFEKTN